MRVMLHDVSDIVSAKPDRFGRSAKAGYTIDSMFKCSFAHMMGMHSNLLEQFHWRSNLFPSTALLQAQLVM
jgi:hypothetical protein